MQKYRAAINRGYFDDYEKDPRAWKHTFAGAYVWKCPKRVSVIEEFRELLGHIPTWEDITDMNLEDLVEVLTKKYSVNTVKNRLGEFKAVITRHIFEVDIPSKRYQSILTGKTEPTNNVYLNEDEVERIYRYKPINHAERYARKIFLIEAYTGARNCDSVRLTKNHCDMETNTLTYVSQKTKTKITLPIHKHLMELLSETRVPSLSLPQFNDTLRKICSKCGVSDDKTLFRRGEERTGEKYQFVSSHTGRRSFATNLYLRGADPVTIARLMGHSSPEITIKSYILAFREISPEVMMFFNGDDKTNQT